MLSASKWCEEHESGLGMAVSWCFGRFFAFWAQLPCKPPKFKEFVKQIRIPASARSGAHWLIDYREFQETCLKHIQPNWAYEHQKTWNMKRRAPKHQRDRTGKNDQTSMVYWLLTKQIAVWSYFPWRRFVDLNMFQTRTCVTFNNLCSEAFYLICSTSGRLAAWIGWLPGWVAGR